MTEILVIRHGQRADEAPQSPEYMEWCQGLERESEDCRWFDPPLTEAGLEQGRQAGALLAQLIENRTVTPSSGRFESEAGRVVLFTSPLLRTVQTAGAMAEALPDAVIQIVPGLCQCAAAVMKYGLDKLNVLTEEEIARALPRLPLARSGVDPAALPQQYMESMEWLASQGPGQYVVVSHREGINDMFRGSRLSTPYCCFARFQVLPGGLMYKMVSLHTNEGRPIKFSERNFDKAEFKNRFSNGFAVRTHKVAQDEDNAVVTCKKDTEEEEIIEYGKQYADISDFQYLEKGKSDGFDHCEIQITESEFQLGLSLTDSSESSQET